MNFCVSLAKKHLLKEVEKGIQSNLVVSPLSFNAVLNMVAAGATGSTLDQMLEFLGSKNIEDINSKSSNMMAVARSSSDNSKNGPILSFLNAAWVDKRFPLKPSYKGILEQIYQAEAKNVDFHTEVDEVIKEANSWAKTASKGHITDVLQPGSIDLHTKLLLANALYFKGAWIHKFVPHCTKKRHFYLLNGGQVSVPFMTSSEMYRYGSHDGFKVLQIPYQSGNDSRKFSMYFFLPDETDGLKDLMQMVNSDPGFLHQDFKLWEVELEEFWIPKFKFSYELEASRIMKDMGLTLPFWEDCRELTEMVHIPNEDTFCLSKVFQKALIEIDEEGTKAAAVTCAGMYLESYTLNTDTFVADHPFIFMIREETSGLVFFTGAVLNPLMK